MKILDTGHHEFVDDVTLNEEINKIIEFLKKDKRTYSANIFLLKSVITKLEEEAKTTIFQ